MEYIVHRDADAKLALAHAERSAQFNLVTDVVLGDQPLQLLDDLTGPLDMAGRADTDGNIHEYVHSFAAPERACVLMRKRV